MTHGTTPGNTLRSRLAVATLTPCADPGPRSSTPAAPSCRRESAAWHTTLIRRTCPGEFPHAKNRCGAGPGRAADPAPVGRAEAADRPRRPHGRGQHGARGHG